MDASILLTFNKLKHLTKKAQLSSADAEAMVSRANYCRCHGYPTVPPFKSVQPKNTRGQVDMQICFLCTTSYVFPPTDTGNG